MNPPRLLPKGWVALTMSALYSAAEALCSVFVSLYLWINSQDFLVVCRYHVTLYFVTPIFFILAGWYSQARDRLHMYRLGLVLHAVFYATLLTLGERSIEHPVFLGALLGVTWGVYWAGANTINFDVTARGRREYFFGLLSAITGVVSLAAPLLSGTIIRYAPAPEQGYHAIFAIVLVLYVVSLAVSFLMPSDTVRRPYRILRALFPRKDQRDWQLMMLASASMAGSFNIFPFVLGLLMYMQTGSELSVGGYASFQALASVVVAYFVGRMVTPRTRRACLRWGLITLLAAGALMAFDMTVATLFLFGLLRSVSGPLFGIPYGALRYDIIADCAEEPAQRIEYIAAWEVPLAIGRVLMMLVMMAVYHHLSGNDVALRLILFVVCAVRIVTYQLVVSTDAMRKSA
jgi:YQGE family putative transporter